MKTYIYRKVCRIMNIISLNRIMLFILALVMTLAMFRISIFKVFSASSGEGWYKAANSNDFYVDNGRITGKELKKILAAVDSDCNAFSTIDPDLEGVFTVPEDDQIYVFEKEDKRSYDIVYAREISDINGYRAVFYIHPVEKNDVESENDVSTEIITHKVNIDEKKNADWGTVTVLGLIDGEVAEDEKFTVSITPNGATETERFYIESISVDSIDQDIPTVGANFTKEFTMGITDANIEVTYGKVSLVRQNTLGTVGHRDTLTLDQLKANIFAAIINSNDSIDSVSSEITVDDVDVRYYPWYKSNVGGDETVGYCDDSIALGSPSPKDDLDEGNVLEYFDFGQRGGNVFEKVVVIGKANTEWHDLYVTVEIMLIDLRETATIEKHPEMSGGHYQVNMNGYYSAKDQEEALAEEILNAVIKSENHNGEPVITVWDEGAPGKWLKLGDYADNDGLSDADFNVGQTKAIKITYPATDKYAEAVVDATIVLCESRPDPVLNVITNALIMDIENWAPDESTIEEWFEIVGLNDSIVDDSFVHVSITAPDEPVGDGESDEYIVSVTVDENSLSKATTAVLSFNVQITNKLWDVKFDYANDNNAIVMVKDSENNDVLSGVPTVPGAFTIIIAPANGYFVSGLTGVTVIGEHWEGNIYYAAVMVNGGANDYNVVSFAACVEKMGLTHETDSYTVPTTSAVVSNQDEFASLLETIYNTVLTNENEFPYDSALVTFNLTQNDIFENTSKFITITRAATDKYPEISISINVTFTFERSDCPITVEHSRVTINYSLDEVLSGITINTGGVDYIASVVGTLPKQGENSKVDVIITTVQTDSYNITTKTVEVDIIGAVTNAKVIINEGANGVLTVDGKSNTFEIATNGEEKKLEIVATPHNDKPYYVNEVKVGDTIINDSQNTLVFNGEITVKDGFGLELGVQPTYTISATFDEASLDLSGGTHIVYVNKYHAARGDKSAIGNLKSNILEALNLSGDYVITAQIDIQSFNIIGTIIINNNDVMLIDIEPSIDEAVEEDALLALELARSNYSFTITKSTVGKMPEVVVENVTIDLVDSRNEVTIKGSDVTFQYGSYTDADLLDAIGAYLADENGNKIDGVTVTCPELIPPYTMVGKYVSDIPYVLTFKFDGNDKYKPCETTFTLMVEKMEVTVKIDDQYMYIDGARPALTYKTYDADGQEIDVMLNLTLVCDFDSIILPGEYPITAINLEHDLYEITARDGKMIAIKQVCTHTITKAVSNGDGTHRIVCQNTECNAAIKVNESCYGGTESCIALANCELCGAEYGFANGHNFGAVVEAEEATCLAKGHDAYKKCTICNKLFAKNAGRFSDEEKDSISDFGIAQKEHSYTGEIQNKDSSWHWYKCINGCQEYGNAEKHTKVLNITKGDKGYQWDDSSYSCYAYFKCRCGVSGKQRAQMSCTVINKATCIQTGAVEYTATFFGIKNSKNQIRIFVENATGHIFTEIIPGTDATCLNSGNEAYKQCMVCNKYFEDTATTFSAEERGSASDFNIAKKSHSYIGAVKSNGDGEKATHSYKCVNGCNRYGGTEKHTWDTGAVTSIPGCESLGKITYHCTETNCPAIYTEPIEAKGHLDLDKNHICDNGCGKNDIGNHSDTDNDHNCDYGCNVPVSDCNDDDSNYSCDICGKNLCESHAYSNVCDSICNKCGSVRSIRHNPATEVQDMTPATCGTPGSYMTLTYCTKCNETLSTLVTSIPATGEHIPAEDDGDCTTAILCTVCNWVVAEARTNHNPAEAENENVVIATCGNSGYYESVVYCDTCNQIISRTLITVPATEDHADMNKDHICDLCGKTISDCADLDPVDGKCDICGKKIVDCKDEDKDHKCDICGTVLSECADENKDHNCDLCGKALTECADENKDHLCDLCGKTLSECADENKDHICDLCGKTLSECADENKDHLCDICGKTLSECAYDNACDADCNICGDVRVPAEHVYDDDKDGTCNVCGGDRVIEPAPTGDPAVTLIVLATAVVALGSAAVVAKKKREEN